jgi:hypothetical protein
MGDLEKDVTAPSIESVGALNVVNILKWVLTTLGVSGILLASTGIRRFRFAGPPEA